MKMPASLFTVTDWLQMRAGMSYTVSDFGDAAHRSSTRTGATLFIVD